VEKKGKKVLFALRKKRRLKYLAGKSASGKHTHSGDHPETKKERGNH